MVQRRTKPRLTITQILDSMQSIADTEYTEDLEGNLLKIFNRLPQDSRWTYLRRSLRMFWEMQVDLARSGGEELPREIVVDNEVRIDPVEVAVERRTIEAMEPYEISTFKSWMLKFSLVSLVFMGVMTFAVVWMAGMGRAVTAEGVRFPGCSGCPSIPEPGLPESSACCSHPGEYACLYPIRYSLRALIS